MKFILGALGAALFLLVTPPPPPPPHKLTVFKCNARPASRRADWSPMRLLIAR